MDFPSNSHKVTQGAQPKPKKKEKEPLKPVVTGEVIVKKRPLGRKFKDVFFGGEFKMAAHYIVTGVMVPAVRNMIVDATTMGIERIIYGESSAQQRRRGVMPEVTRSKFSYGAISSRDPRVRGNLPDQAPVYSPSRTIRGISDITLISREEAEMVLDRLNDIIDEYDVASVADLHELTGLPTAYTDNNYGWSSLANASVRQTRDGFLLDLPPAEKI